MSLKYNRPTDDYFHRLSLGLIPYHSSIYKFGRNESVGNAETVIATGGIYGLPETAEPVICQSTSGLDIVGGTGARVVEITGLNENWLEIKELVNMNTLSIQSFIRVYRVRVMESGNIDLINGGNQGFLTVGQSISGIPMIQVDQYDGQTKTACYTVPADCKAIIWDADTTTGEGKNSFNTLKSRNNSNPNEPFQGKGARDNYQNLVGQEFKIGRPIEPTTDLVFTATSSASGTSVSATFLLELIHMS